ncbi:hypothetical protein ACFLZP_04435 [Patescibacteria group bacterium]
MTHRREYDFFHPSGNWFVSVPLEKRSPFFTPLKRGFTDRIVKVPMALVSGFFAAWLPPHEVKETKRDFPKQFGTNPSQNHFFKAFGDQRKKGQHRVANVNP